MKFRKEGMMKRNVKNWGIGSIEANKMYVFSKLLYK